MTSAPSSTSITIRPATVADVPQMHRIINQAAEFGLMLPKSYAQLYENIREFNVAVDRESNDLPVIGVCGLSIIWANLAEVVSLAVDSKYRGKGIGQALVAASLDDAKVRGIKKIMTLTYEQAFFEKLGFAVVDRQSLPMKVWSECVRCPKQNACDEIAMLHTIDDIPDIPGPPPSDPPPNQYVVPTPLTRRGQTVTRRPTLPLDGD